MISASILVSAALAADALTVGSAAPPFTPELFLSGSPVRAIEPGKVHVIEFWATWCGPCIRAMPHLAKLQADNPDIVVVGIAGLERVDEGDRAKADAAKEAKVRDFLAKRGNDVGFAVALDTDASMVAQWMNAARRNTIPCSFVVGMDGRIAFIGSPDARLDEAVRRAKQMLPPEPPAARDSASRPGSRPAPGAGPNLPVPPVPPVGGAEPAEGPAPKAPAPAPPPAGPNG